MKESYTHINKRLYYLTVLVSIALMCIGFIFDNPLMAELESGLLFHSILIVSLSISLLLYPIFATHWFRVIIMIIASTYFYTIFFLYPETGSSFIYLCFIPAIAILFFDTKLFYFSLIFNNISIIATFSFIIFSDKGAQYFFIREDIFGSVINYLGSQAIIYFIFYLSYGRITKLQLYYEQIKQAERLKTTGQLAAAVAHEIRNPLTVVKGFLQLYKEDTTSIEDLKIHLPLLIDELNTAEEVISQFLSVAKPSSCQELEAVNVKAVLQSVTDLLNSYGLLHDNKIELNVMDDCFIDASNIEFKQLLINIVKNAIEASNIGDSVKIMAERKKNVIEIKVIDQGQGMSKEEIDSLGTPFYSLKSKGTGLGMMICFNIVAKYKGTIDFQSYKEKGTTVTICFPAKNEAVL